MDTGLRRYDGVFFVVGRLGDGVPIWLDGGPRSGRGVGILSVCMGIFLAPCFCLCPPIQSLTILQGLVLHRGTLLFLVVIPAQAGMTVFFWGASV